MFKYEYYLFDVLFDSLIEVSEDLEFLLFFSDEFDEDEVLDMIFGYSIKIVL